MNNYNRENQNNINININVNVNLQKSKNHKFYKPIVEPVDCTNPLGLKPEDRERSAKELGQQFTEGLLNNNNPVDINIEIPTDDQVIKTFERRRIQLEREGRLI